MKTNPKWCESSFYQECSKIVKSGNFCRIDWNASVPGGIARNIGQSFKYAVVLASTLSSTPPCFIDNEGIMPDGPFFLIRITRDDTSHGIRHENTNEKLVWKTKSGESLSIDKKPKNIPDHRVDYLFENILNASPLRVIKSKPAPNPPNKEGTWKEYNDLCASLNKIALFE
ncbi:MAG: hypothetical protein KKI12_04380 [Proteobacteria bacterium]|nr:hypothetical protein [Pseudomonadota bacterium]MBU4287392.1 hypothetical protein [Pseudomonadota bacterium]